MSGLRFNYDLQNNRLDDSFIKELPELDAFAMHLRFKVLKCFDMPLKSYISSVTILLHRPASEGNFMGNFQGHGTRSCG